MDTLETYQAPSLSPMVSRVSYVMALPAIVQWRWCFMVFRTNDLLDLFGVGNDDAHGRPFSTLGALPWSLNSPSSIYPD
jgi:hypothetical protein